jgi:hypothetical protein
MALDLSAFSQNQLNNIYNRNPSWARPQQTAATTTMPNNTNNVPTVQPGQNPYAYDAQQRAQGAQSQQTTPASNAATGGIDFSGLMPSFSMNQSSNSSNSQANSGLSQMGQQALQPLLGTGQGSMPSLIDQWAGDTIGKLDVNQRDIMNTINQSMNVLANKGIVGGTEATNLRSQMLLDLINPTLDRQAGVLNSAMNAKANAMPTLLGLTRQSNSTATGSGNGWGYSQSPDDYQIISNIINSNW